MQTANADPFFREYTSQEAVLKYTRATAGCGISYLLDHEYKAVYAEALGLLTKDVKRRGIRLLEFGCGGGMNLLHLVSVLDRDSIHVERAIGTDFSPVLIEAAKREAGNCLREDARRRVEFHVAKNETLMDDLSMATEGGNGKLRNSFHFIFGVNTIRYCHRGNRELDCSRGIFDLLAPGGVCVVIDMNDRFLFFRSAWRNHLYGRKQSEIECYVPSLEEYTAPFIGAGFDVLRSQHFCWIPHSSGQFMCRLLSAMSPLLNTLARSRAMRSLVVARKPKHAGIG